MVGLVLGILAIACSRPAARAILTGTTEGSQISGEATLEETNAGLRIQVRLSNAPPGSHGFHIHVAGNCADGGKSAGGHYNPDEVKHGDLLKDGFEGAHAGDLGNLEVGPDGTGAFDKVLPGLTLTVGRYPVGGRALILHGAPDDFGQPTGNAGARIACGTIRVD
jgi:Cu-Zn family superoxide dismutase